MSPPSAVISLDTQTRSEIMAQRRASFAPPQSESHNFAENRAVRATLADSTLTELSHYCGVSQVPVVLQSKVQSPPRHEKAQSAES